MKVQTNPDSVMIHDDELQRILAYAIREATGRDMAEIAQVEFMPVYVLDRKQRERVTLTVTLKPRSEA